MKISGEHAALIQIGKTRGRGAFSSGTLFTTNCTWIGLGKDIGFRGKRQATGRWARLGIAIIVYLIRLPATCILFQMWTAGTFPPAGIGQAEVSFLRQQNAIILSTFHLYCTGYRELLVCGLYYRRVIGRSVLPKNENISSLELTSNLKLRPKIYRSTLPK
jgi:hypothetical protein